MIKRIFLIVAVMVAMLGAVSLLSPRALAFDPTGDVCNLNQNGSRNSSACSVDSPTNPISGGGGIISKVTQLVALLAGIAAVIMIIISGIQFATSGGDAQKIATARQTILYAIIGVVIAAIAQSLVLFVLSKL